MKFYVKQPMWRISEQQIGISRHIDLSIVLEENSIELTSRNFSYAVQVKHFALNGGSIDYDALKPSPMHRILKNQK